MNCIHNAVYNNKISYKNLNIFSLELFSCCTFTVKLFQKLKIDGKFFDEFLKQSKKNDDKIMEGAINDCYKPLIFLQINSRFNFASSVQMKAKDKGRDDSLLKISKILVSLIKKLMDVAKIKDKKDWEIVETNGTRLFHIKEFLKLMVEILIHFQSVGLVRDYVFRQFTGWSYSIVNVDT